MTVVEPLRAADAVRTRPATLARNLLVAAALSAVCAAIVYALFVRTGLGQRFDNAALAGSHQQLPGTRAADISALQRITADSFAVVLVILAAIGVVRRRPRLGIAAALSAGIAVVGTDLLKYDVLPRPFLVRSDYLLAPNTFPSGHSATAIACAFALVVVSPPRWRGLAAVVAGSYGWLTAAQVQTAGWHRPSDAIGAAFVAFTAVTLVTAGVVAWRPTVRYGGSGHRIALSILGMVWVVAAAITVFDMARVLRFLATHADALTFTAAIQNDAYQISVNLTVVVVVTLLMALLVLIGGHDLDAPRPPTGSAATS